jgi:hypothetical protein
MHVVGNLTASSSLVVIDERGPVTEAIVIEKLFLESTNQKFVSLGGNSGIPIAEYFSQIRRNPQRFW